MPGFKGGIINLFLKEGFFLLGVDRSSVFYNENFSVFCFDFFNKRGFSSSLGCDGVFKIQFKKKPKDVYILMKLFAEVLVVK